WRTYGTIRSSGCRVQAVTPASASDAPINRRNVRRATGSVIASISDGNSLYSRSWNSGSSARSSSVRQKGFELTVCRPREATAENAEAAEQTFLGVLCELRGSRPLRSSMTRGAARELLDLILGDELFSELQLI